jgi:hypothetical protein
MKIIPFFSFISIFVFLIKSKTVSKPIIKISPEHEYKKRNKERFLESFQETEHDIKYNENIDPVFYNREEYNKIVSASDNVLEPKWKRAILYESTPRGNVIMFYDAYKEGFSYYSDSQMTYDILNMAAIKYSILFRCRNFFVDEQQYPNGHVSPLIKLKEDQDTKPLSNKIKLEGPFIKYKKSAANSLVLPVKIYSQNKFVHLGKICNFSFLKKELVTRPNVKTSFSSIFQKEQNAQHGVFDYRKFKESRGL